MRTSYFDDPGLLESPKMQKYEREDLILAQLLYDIEPLDDSGANKHRLGDDVAKMNPSRDNVLSRNFRQVWETDKLFVAQALAGRLWLDSMDLERLYLPKAIKKESKRARDAPDFHITPEGAMDTIGARWPRILGS